MDVGSHDIDVVAFTYLIPSYPHSPDGFTAPVKFPIPKKCPRVGDPWLFTLKHGTPSLPYVSFSG